MAARRTPHTLAALALVGPVLLVSALFAFSAQGAGNNELKGRYVLRHSDDFAGGKARFQPMLELADGTLLELNYGLSHAPNVNPGSNVTIKGSRKGNTVLVAEGGTQVTAGPSQTVAAGTTKRVAVVLFTFSNATTQPYTPLKMNP